MTVARQTDATTSAKRFYLTVHILKQLPADKVKKLTDMGAVVPSTYKNRIASDILKELDQYIYVPVVQGETWQGVSRWLAGVIPKASFQALGLERAEKIDELIQHCYDLTEESLANRTFYRVTRGELKGFFVRIISTSDEEAIVSPLFGPNSTREYTIAKGALTQEADLSMPKAITHRSIRNNQQNKYHAMVVDGHNLLFRSAFGNSTKFASNRTDFIGGAVGFYYTTLRLCRAYPEYELHFVFDPDWTIHRAFGWTVAKGELPEGATTVAARTMKMPEYKANREKLKPKFYDQLSLNLVWVLHFLKACGFPVYSHPHHEGDNILSALVHDIRRQRPNPELIIYSTDTDMYQLVDPHTNLYQPKKRSFDYNSLIGEADVLAQFRVGEVRKINWVRAILGDGTDNIRSFNQWCAEAVGPRPLLTSKVICDLAKDSDSLEAFKANFGAMSPEHQTFISEKFDPNMSLLVLLQSIEGISLKPHGEPDKEKLEQLLIKIGLFKEIELLSERVLPALMAYA